MDKRAVLMKVSNEINKTHSEVVVGFASEVAKKIEFLKLPSEALNVALGGGVARGRITEIFGFQSSGKTSLVLETIGEDMQADPDSYWAWYESEESFDLDYAVNVHGIDPKRLILIDLTEEGAEKGIDRLESYMRSGVLTGVVINSVAGLTPKKEFEDSMEDQNIALQARMMSKLMRKWAALIGKKRLYAIFLNQLRTDVNSRFGDPNVTTGGRALSYYASQRFGMNNLKLQESDPLKADEGMKIGIRIAKNRMVYDNPYKKAEYYVIYGEGTDKFTEIIENGPDAGILRKSGAWYYYEQEDGELIEAEKAIINGTEEENVPLKFNGKTKLREFLKENLWFFEQLKQELQGKAARGELMPTYQTEEEMKEIEELQKIEKEAAAKEQSLLDEIEKEEAKKKEAKSKTKDTKSKSKAKAKAKK